MKTLVACPVAERKHYSFPMWAAATGGYDRLVVTEDEDYADTVEGYGVPVLLFEPVSTFQRFAEPIYGPRHTEAWRAIIDNAQGYTHILSLESDIIPPTGVDILSLMEEHYYDCDFLCHAYPWRYPSRRGQYAYETGCTLSSVEKWREALEKTHEENGLYSTIRCQDYFKNKDIHIVQLEHLGEGDDRF